MATDYDTPRKTDEELHEESLEELKARRADAQSGQVDICLLYTSPSPRDGLLSRMPSSA